MNRKDLIPLSFLCFCCILYFNSIIFLQEVVYAGDNVSLFIPYKTFLIQAINKGQVPLWNPYILYGTAFLGDISAGTFYLSNIFYFFFHPLYALSYSLIVHTVLSGLSIYFLTREYKQGYCAAILTALLWMFSGTSIQLSQNIASFETVMWLPISILFIELYGRNSGSKYLFCFIFSLVLQFFAGHTQFFYYNYLLYIAYIVSVMQKPLREKLSFIMLSSIFFVLISAVQLFPFLEYSQHSTRPINDYKYASASLPPINLFHLFLANFFGVQKDGTSWGAQASVIGYVGILPFFIIGFSGFKQWSRLRLFFLIVMIVTLLISVGYYSPLYYLAFHLLPFFSRFRSPASILTIYTFAVCVLTGLSLHNFLEKLKAIHNRKGVWILFFLLSLCGLINFLFKREVYSLTMSSLTTTQHYIHLPVLQKFIDYPSVKLTVIFDLWLSNMSVINCILATFVLFIALSKKTRISYVALGLIMLCATDVVYFGRNAYMTASAKMFRTPEVIQLFFRGKSEYIYTLIDPPERPTFGDANYYLKEALKQYVYLKPNTNMLLDIKSIDGYASMIHKEYPSILMSKSPINPTSLNPIPINSAVLNELNVRYILVSDKLRQQVSNYPQYQKKLEYFNPTLQASYYIYENMNTKKYSSSLNSRSFNKVLLMKLTELQKRSVLSQQKSFHYGMVVSLIGMLGLAFYVSFPLSFFSRFKNIIRK